jgi:hypothetical protein
MTTTEKPRRIRRTKAQMAAARAEAEHGKMLDAMSAGIEARLALATPQQIKSAERTIAYWARQARRY